MVALFCFSPHHCMYRIPKFRFKACLVQGFVARCTTVGLRESKRRVTQHAYIRSGLVSQQGHRDIPDTGAVHYCIDAPHFPSNSYGVTVLQYLTSTLSSLRRFLPVTRLLFKLVWREEPMCIAGMSAPAALIASDRVIVVIAVGPGGTYDLVRHWLCLDVSNNTCT